MNMKPHNELICALIYVGHVLKRFGLFGVIYCYIFRIFSEIYLQIFTFLIIYTSHELYPNCMSQHMIVITWYEFKKEIMKELSYESSVNIQT